MADLCPTDIDAERAVLGALLFSPQNWPATLSVDDFSLSSHRIVFSAINTLRENGDVFDIVSVSWTLRDKGKLESIGGASFLADLDVSAERVIGLNSYVKRIKEKAKQRKAIASLDAALKTCCGEYDDVAPSLEKLNKVAEELRADSSGNTGMQTTADVVNGCGGLQVFMTTTKASVTTPFPALNRNLGGGFRNSEVVILGARTSVGKTSCALQMGVHAASRGIPTAIFSLEMGPVSLIHRMACTHACVDSNAFRNNYLSTEERKALQIAVGEISEMPIYYGKESSYTVPKIVAAVRTMRDSGYRIGFVVVDYLQLVDAVGRVQNRTEAVGSVSRALKVAAVEFNIPFLVLSQLSRAADESDAVPLLRHLRECGGIEQDADIVLFLHVAEKDRYGDIKPVKLIVAKQRNGPLDTLDLNFRGIYTRFEQSIDATGMPQ